MDIVVEKSFFFDKNFEKQPRWYKCLINDEVEIGYQW